MRSDLRHVCLLSILLLVVVCQVQATEFKTGEKVSISEGTTIDDEVYAFAQSIVVSGAVTSDLVAASNDLRLGEKGSVGGSANLAGSSVRVAGKVAGNLRAAGSDVIVSGPVGGNAALAGANVTLAGSGKITRDLFAAGGQIDIEGSVGRNLHVAAEEVTVNAPVGGNVMLEAQQVNIGPEAVIKGNLVYTSPMRAKIDPGASIVGKTVYHKGEAKNEGGFGPLKWLLRALGFVALFIVGLVPLTIAPKGAADIAQTVLRSPWLSMLIGFIVLVVIPAAVMVLIFTVVAIPLAIGLLWIYLIMLYMSRIPVGLAIGRWILARDGREPSRYLAFFVGLLIFWIVTAIPYVGPVISFAGLLVGLGAVLWDRFSFLKQLRAEGRM